MENHKLSLPQTLTAIAAVITATTGFISLFNHEDDSLQEQTYKHTVRPGKGDLPIVSPPNESSQYHHQISRDGQNNINGSNIKNDGIIIIK